MNLYIRKTYATIRFPAGSKEYVNQYLNTNHDIVGAGGQVVGELWARGRGWYRLTATHLRAALSIIHVALRKFRADRDAEIRSLLVRAVMPVKTVAAVCNGSFVNYVSYLKSGPVRKVTLPPLGSSLAKSLSLMADRWGAKRLLIKSK